VASLGIDNTPRPTVIELLDALGETHSGARGRLFHPDDHATLEAYRAAQAKRGAVDTAEHGERKLSEDVGKSITLDDLDANQLLASAYEDQPRMTGKIGNVNLAHF
jgi:hypothetical protein